MAANTNAPEADINVEGSCPWRGAAWTYQRPGVSTSSSLPFFSPPSDFPNLEHFFPPWQEGQGKLGFSSAGVTSPAAISIPSSSSEGDAGALLSLITQGRG